MQQNDDVRGEHASNKEGEFIKWCVEHHRNIDSPPCPFSADELFAIASSLGRQGPSFVQRAAIVRGRRAIVKEQTGSSALALEQLNNWREQLARSYLNDAALPKASRLDQAIEALLEKTLRGDDLERARTLAIAGDLYYARSLEQRNASGDVLLAVRYYLRAWETGGYPDYRENAFTAALHLVRLANADEKEATHHAVPHMRGSWSDLRSARANELMAAARSKREQAASLYEGLIRCAEHALVMSDTASGTRPQELRADPLKLWDIAASQFSADPQTSDTLGPVKTRERRQIWVAGLVLLRAHFAAGRWAEANGWMERTRSGETVFNYGDDPGADSIRECLRRMLEAHAVASTDADFGQPHGEAILKPLLESEIRDSLSDWLKAPLSPDASFDEHWEAGGAALQKSRAYELRDEALSRLIDEIIDSNRRGRIGLALSGGGFRAAFFHLGVLARLADLDLLRHIEVISCVSGGAIVGACYFLKLKQLLETTPDAELSKADYIRLVTELSDEFAEGVQTNLRMQLFTDYRTIAKRLFHPEYNRTDRLAELIHAQLFGRVMRGVSTAMVPLKALTIRPAAEKAAFNSRTDNWARSAKVPSLIINATTLNTGHNWQFGSGNAAVDAAEGPRMGEPLYSTDPELDVSHRLEMRSAENVTLATAVAASACVPGVFPPIELTERYPLKDRFSSLCDPRLTGTPSDAATVRLVDGGLFDNQGVSALFDRQCDVMIISDGSQQLQFKADPAVSTLGSLRRSNAILSERVRQLQLSKLLELHRKGILRDLAIVHLTQGLEGKVLREGPRSGPRPDDALEFFDRVSTTPQGFLVKVQSLVASLRTDLDHFNQSEIYALFCFGYALSFTQGETNKRILKPTSKPTQPPEWPAFQIVDQLTNDTRESKRLIDLLCQSRKVFGKEFALIPGSTKAIALVLVIAMIAILTIYVGPWIGVLGAVTLLGALISIIRNGGPSKRLYQKVGRVVAGLIAVLLMPFAIVLNWIFVKWLTPAYLTNGTLDAAIDPARPPGGNAARTSR